MKHLKYTDADRTAIARQYVRLAIAQFTQQKLVKAKIVRELMEVTGRTRGAIEACFMNISHSAKQADLLPQLPDGYVKGYKPAPNGAKAWPDFLQAALKENPLNPSYSRGDKVSCLHPSIDTKDGAGEAGTIEAFGRFTRNHPREVLVEYGSQKKYAWFWERDIRPDPELTLT